MRFILPLTLSLSILSCAYATDDAIPRTNRAASENDAEFETIRNLVEVYIEQRNYDTADSILADYMKKDSLNAQAIYLKGRIYDLTENINDAMSAYLRAAELDSTLWRAYRDLAYLYDIFSNYESMNRLMKNAVIFAPAKDSLYYDYGYSFDMLGQLDSAEFYYQKALDFDSLDYQAFLNLGAIIGLSGNLDSAKILLEKATGINPDSPETLYNLGEIDLSLGLFDRAAGCFQQALALDPGLFAAKKRLGDLFEILGDSGMARLYYEDFLDSVPPIYLDDISDVRKKLENYK